MVVKARLEGHSFDLDTLAELFNDGEPMVGTDDDGHYIKSLSFDGLFQDGGLLRDAAEAILRRANSVARALGDGYRPVRLTGRFTDDGGTHHQVVVLDTVEVREKVHAMTFFIDGEPQQPPPSPAPGYFKAADTHPDVGAVLDLLGTGVVALD